MVKGQISVGLNSMISFLDVYRMQGRVKSTTSSAGKTLTVGAGSKKMNFERVFSTLTLRPMYLILRVIQGKKRTRGSEGNFPTPN